MSNHIEDRAKAKCPRCKNEKYCYPFMFHLMTLDHNIRSDDYACLGCLKILGKDLHGFVRDPVTLEEYKKDISVLELEEKKKK